VNAIQISPTVKDIVKTKGVLRFQQDQKLSEVLSSLVSSHDAAFVFNSEEFEQTTFNRKVNLI